MAIFVVVDKDKDPLGPGEIQAGGTILVNDGDIFIFDATANATTKFEAATAGSTDFEIQFNASNTNDFNVEIEDDLNAEITIADNVNLEDVDFKAKDAESVILTAGNNVTIGDYDGSDTGADTLTFGDNFTTDKDIDTNGGDDVITIGDDATLDKIETGDGTDTITIGDGLVADDIKTGDGDDALTIGDDATLDKIETEEGSDTITIGDGLVATDIKTGDGDDALTIGDDATLDKIETKDGDDTVTIGDGLVIDDIKTGDGDDALTIGDDAVTDDIDTGKGDDSVTLGDNFEGDKVETKDGDDVVIIGSGGSIDDLDGGKGNDSLDSDTDFPDAQNFETIVCFAQGTLIRTDRGNVPIEALTEGDRVKTMDNGLQSIRWIGSTTVPGYGSLAPVRIAKGALGNAQELWVSQQHRMLISDWRADLHFGEAEVLVPAKYLVEGSQIDIVEVEAVTYFHMLFDRHEIVFAEGAASESFHPGQVGMSALSRQSREEIFQIFPDLRANPAGFPNAARRSLKSYESSFLAA